MSKTQKPSISVSAKEWEEARCAICMEPPHNAVVLECSSFVNGCRSYMCNNTNHHRLSNCFEQYKESLYSTEPSENKLLCPLCRGQVNRWIKSSPDAESLMNAKPKSCCNDGCDFTGTYKQLLEHAESKHSHVGPTEAERKRRHDWEVMEQEERLSSLQLEQDEEYALTNLINFCLETVGFTGLTQDHDFIICEDEDLLSGHMGLVIITPDGEEIKITCSDYEALIETANQVHRIFREP